MNIIEFFVTFPLFFIFTALLMGLLVGSFLNVVVYRLPKMMLASWQQEAREILELPTEKPVETFNLLYPPSACPHCGHKISPFENVPIISYLLLKGSCKGCKAHISLRYPLVELTTGVLSAFLAWYLDCSPQVLLLILLTWALLAASLIDMDHQLLPDSIVLPFLWIGLIANNYGIFTSINDAIWGAVIGYMVLWSVNAAHKLLRGYDGLGHGDFKLLALFGAWGGWQILPVIILLSAFTGAVIGIINWLLTGKNKMPFGPYLAIAGWIALLWGQKIIDCYLVFAGLAR